MDYYREMACYSGLLKSNLCQEVIKLPSKFPERGKDTGRQRKTKDKSEK